MFFFSSNYTIGKPGSDLMKAYFSKMLNDLNKLLKNSRHWTLLCSYARTILQGTILHVFDKNNKKMIIIL